MTTNPQHVRTALQTTETQLQGLIEPVELQLQNATQAINETSSLVTEISFTLRKRLAEIERAIRICEAQRRDNTYINCSHLYLLRRELDQNLSQLQRLALHFEQINDQYLNNASALQKMMQHDIPAACHWLRKRDESLSRFEKAEKSLGGKSPGLSTETSHLTTLGKVAMMTESPVLFSAFTAALNRMGNHGYAYQKSRQKYLRSLVNDKKQPSYVRGWVHQELNRIERVEKAKAVGQPPPGRTSRQIKGIHGLDVGHRFPNIDLVENFRLENASMNRRRYFIAKRLGIEKIYR